MKRAMVLAALCFAATAHADRTVLRLATAAPDATSWAKELRAFSRDVESSTDGQVAIKWYMGGMADGIY